MDMLKLFIIGSGLGMAAGFAPGPLLTMVISQTIGYGFKEGVKTAFTPMITDLPVIVVATFLVSGIYTLKPLLGLVSVAGGILLCYLAWQNLKRAPVYDSSSVCKPNSIVKGALINALSPHPYLFWITVGSPILLAAYAQNFANAAAFVLGFYACLIGAKIILAYFVMQTRSFFFGQPYVWLMRLLGLVLFAFAIILFKDGFVLLFE
jgi:threonine/homoserine/homoserine lactone efflux protein